MTGTRAGQPRLAAAASFAGSALEYYDFFLYGAASALVFGPLFFPTSEPVVGTLAALGTFAAGYLARPFGAVVIGHFGDRYGRKRMLVLTLVAMGVCTFAIGCLPTYASIGVAAPILLLVLRLLQGMAVAGESGGAATLSLEHASPTRRAFTASWVNQGASAGSVLASIAFLALSAMPAADFQAWGWRIPFWLSLLVVLVGLVIRLRLAESPTFRRVGQRERFPLRTVLTRQRSAVLRVVGSAVVTAVVPMNQVFGLAHGVEQGIPRGTMLVIGLISMAVAVLTQPCFALLADRIGRRPVFVTGGVVIAATSFVFFTGLDRGAVTQVFVGSLLMMSLGSAMCASITPALWGEMFDTRVRYTGLSFANSLGGIFPGFGPAIAAGIIAAGGSGLGVAFFLAGCGVFGALVILTARETRGVSIDALGGLAEGGADGPSRRVARGESTERPATA